MSKAVTLRLPDADAAEVRRIAEKERRSVSEVGARIVDEWLRQNRFPQIEFRSINGERVACIKGRLEVWQVMAAAQSSSNRDLATVARRLDLRPDQVQGAYDYAAAYPEELREALAENQEGYSRLQRLFPGICRTSISDEDLATVVLEEMPAGQS
ncbi:MAG TPA: hypothetical protein VGS41_17125 [Chthonomonadales bacterium]|nr:hypothetical protein [Chthonomonadales bacterium]